MIFITIMIDVEDQMYTLEFVTLLILPRIVFGNAAEEQTSLQKVYQFCASLVKQVKAS